VSLPGEGRQSRQASYHLGEVGSTFQGIQFAPWTNCLEDKERDAEGDRHGGKDLVEEILHIFWVENVGSFPDSSHGRRGEIGATAVGCGGRFERIDPEQSTE